MFEERALRVVWIAFENLFTCRTIRRILVRRFVLWRIVSERPAIVRAPATIIPDVWQAVYNGDPPT